MGFILFIICLILSPLLVLGIFYSATKFTFSLNFNKLNNYFFNVSLALDKLANVVLGFIMNDLLLKTDGYLFGNGYETMSAVFGKNKKLHKLNMAGRAIAWILDKIQPDHVEVAVEDDIIK